MAKRKKAEGAKVVAKQRGEKHAGAQPIEPEATQREGDKLREGVKAAARALRGGAGK